MLTPNSVGTSGRPVYDISHEQLQFLLDAQFTVPEMAQILGVSTRTVSRRLTSFNLRIRAIFLTIIWMLLYKCNSVNILI